MAAVPGALGAGSGGARRTKRGQSYPTSEVSGSGLGCKVATEQEQLRGASLHPRSGAAAERYPTSKVKGDG